MRYTSSEVANLIDFGQFSEQEPIQMSGEQAIGAVAGYSGIMFQIDYDCYFKWTNSSDDAISINNSLYIQGGDGIYSFYFPILPNRGDTPYLHLKEKQFSEIWQRIESTK